MSLESLRAWRLANPDKARLVGKNSRDRYRREAVLRVGRGVATCRGCGCDAFGLLEINHINGGGVKEFARIGPKFYRDIANQKRGIEDLDIRCKVCNARHALELKFGPQPYQIVWCQP